MKNTLIYIILIALFSHTIIGQNGVGIGTINPNSSAVLDIHSTSKGVLIPRLSKTERQSISAPAHGLLVLDTIDNSLYLFDGVDWLALNSIDGLIDGKIDLINENVYLGFDSGINSDSSAQYNTALGVSAMFFNEKGDHNVALGYHALYSGDSCINNIAIGSLALRSNMSSSNNVAIGRSSMFHNIDGSDNVSIGTASGTFNRGGIRNVNIGTNANYNNRDGDRNTIIGFNAGFSNAVHNKNGAVYLGYNAGYTDTTDNKLYIENSSSSYPLIYGDFANDTVRIYGTLGIGDEYNFPLFDGNVDQVLSTNGTGDLSWASPVIIDSLNDLGDMYCDYTNLNMIGGNGGQSLLMDVKSNTGWGSNSLRDLTSGNDNTAVGALSLYQNTTGSYNSALGRFSLAENIDGEYNTAVGFHAMFSNSIGDYNIAFGAHALKANKTGNYNVALGESSLIKSVSGNYNVAIGNRAMYEKTSGNDNVAVGEHSLFSNIDGDFNTALGSDAGYLCSGDYNVFIGASAGYNETSDNKLYIDNSDTSQPLVWGDFALDSLDLNGKLRINSTNSSYDFVIGEYSGEPVLKATNTNFGYLGTPTQTLYQVYSNFFYAGGTGNYLTYSDRKLKENIQSLSNQSDFLLQLNPVKYNLKKEAYVTKKMKGDNSYRMDQLGLIAQEVEEIFPQLVQTDPNTGLKSVAYQGLIPVAIQVIKEQEERIDILEDKVNRLIKLLEQQK